MKAYWWHGGLHFDPETDQEHEALLKVEELLSWMGATRGPGGALSEQQKERQAPPEALARPIEDWHEDLGPVLWWRFPVTEAPWAGTPHDSDWPMDQPDEPYFTYWTPLPPVPRYPG